MKGQLKSEEEVRNVASEFAAIGSIEKWNGAVGELYETIDAVQTRFPSHEGLKDLKGDLNKLPMLYTH